MDRDEALFPDVVPVKIEYKDVGLDDIILSDEEGNIADVEKEDIIPEVSKKTKINQKEIFIEEKKKEEPPIIKAVIEPTKELKIPQKKGRKPMSEEHKKKLALAREKANATRKKNAIERKKQRELLKQEKELETKIKVKKVEKMKKEIEEPVEEKSDKDNIKVVKIPEYTQDALNKAIADGIASYEVVRKKRKEAKKKLKEEEEHQKKIFNTVHKAVHNPEIDKWGICFQ
jgi:hypothetical protein